MMRPSEPAHAIELVEERVRSGERITLETLRGAFQALQDLQDDRAGRHTVAPSACAVQRWLGQYISAQMDQANGVVERGREASLRRMTLRACEDLRIAIARSRVGAA